MVKTYFLFETIIYNKKNIYNFEKLMKIITVGLLVIITQILYNKSWFMIP